MKSTDFNRCLAAAEWVLIGVMAFCGMLAFINSNAYTNLHDLISSHYSQISSYLPGIIWGFIFIFGVVSVTLLSRGGGSLTWLVALFSLTSFLSYDSINIFKVISWTPHITTKLPLWVCLWLGVLIMVSYLLLSHMNLLKRARRSLINRGASPQDMENINAKNHIIVLIAIGATLLAVALIGLISSGIEYLIEPYLDRVPWYEILIGLGCLLILAIYLYWLGARRSQTN